MKIDINDVFSFFSSSYSNTITRVFDVADLENSTLVHVYESSETACDHNQYVTDDNLVYQANYEAGLRVLELNEADGSLTEVAYFDIHPTSTDPQFNGAWSNYPWLAGSERLKIAYICSILSVVLCSRHGCGVDVRVRSLLGRARLASD